MSLSINNVKWKNLDSLHTQQIPVSLRSFLFDIGSTTRRIQREYGVTTKVNILRQDWRTPSFNEAQKLRIPRCQSTLIRETYLSCQDKIWMYARAVFPQKLFVGKMRSLLYKLDEQPLGKLLFCEPSMQRSEFEFAALCSRHAEYQWATQQQAAPNLLWARRSIFLLQAKPLLLTEVFFPAILELERRK